jgi:hypothetical protein
MKKRIDKMLEYEIFRLRENGNIYMVLSFSKSCVRIYNFRSKEAKDLPNDTEVYPIY